MKKQNILIVDDEGTNLSILAEMLGETYNLLGATDGVTALEIANSDEGVDLILLDIIMPEMDGYEVAHQLKNNKKTAEIPFIFLTAKSDTQSIVKGFQEGAVDYISKPFAKEELLARVHNHLQLHKLNSELYKNKNFLQTILDYSSHAVIVTDLDGTITLFNKSAEGMLKYSSSELVGKKTPAIFHKTTQVRQRAEQFSKELGIEVEIGFDVFVAKSKCGLENTHEWNYITKNKKKIIVNLSVSVLKDELGNISGYMGIAEDITERKEMEKELHLKEEMMLTQSKQAAMGEMISMIAHQWRQPLNIVGLAVANIQTKHAFHMLDDKTFEDNAEIIADNIAFMSGTIDHFRNYFKPDAPKELTKIEVVIDTVLGIIGKSLENNGILFNVENNSKNSLFIHKNSLVQVLINIVSNAQDALISNKVAGARIKVTVNETQDSIVISVCDNAGGIPNDIIDKIHEPYFSTKALIGTGLGLYISHIIIEKHLFGTFKWHNEDKGTCFVITLNLKQTFGLTAELTTPKKS